MKTHQRKAVLLSLLCVTLCLGLTGCGGGSSTSPPPPPPPPQFTITTSSLPNGTTATFYNQTFTASGGTGQLTWQISSGVLPGGLSLSNGGVLSGLPTVTGTFNFTVRVQDSSLTPKTATKSLSMTLTGGPLAIATSSLPNGTLGASYVATLFASGGTPSFTWSIPNAADLANFTAAGLALNPSTGEISGTLMAGVTPATVNFTVQVSDSAAAPATLSRALSLTIVPASGGGAPGRNDSPGAATLLSNGTFRASISPLDNPGGVLVSDTDFYSLTASGGSIVTVEITALRLPSPSPLDSVIRIVDSGGNVPGTCITPDSTSGQFVDVCLNDDIILGGITDSRLAFRVPAGGPLTFFVQVIDFSGNARPDLFYSITVTGAN